MNKFYVSLKVQTPDGQVGKLAGPVVAPDASAAEALLRSMATKQGIKVVKTYQVAPWKDELLGGVVPTAKSDFEMIHDEARAYNNTLSGPAPKARITHRNHSGIEHYPDLDTFLAIAL